MYLFQFFSNIKKCILLQLNCDLLDIQNQYKHFPSIK